MNATKNTENMRNQEHEGYALLESGYVHTDQLTKASAEEMLERHRRIFDDIDWDITFFGKEEWKKAWES